jgi:hypothetical protein
MPEIAPGGDFGANIDRPFTDRSMVLQAWGAYGVLWPVIRQQLGVAPDAGRSALTVVPRIPDGQDRVSGRNIRVGSGSVDVTAVRARATLVTTVTRRAPMALTIGAVIPYRTEVKSVRLDGRPAEFTVRRVPRGTEVVVEVPAGLGASGLTVSYR